MWAFSCDYGRTMARTNGTVTVAPQALDDISKQVEALKRQLLTLLSFQPFFEGEKDISF